MFPDVFEELKWRGMVFDYVEGVQDLLAREKVTIYNGFDATADSLHIASWRAKMTINSRSGFSHTGWAWERMA